MSVPTSKASFTFHNVGSSATFYVQFNPSEMKMDDSAAWKESETKHKSKPKITYDKAAPSMLNMKLFFDTTDSGESVDEKYVKHLRAGTDATYVKEVNDGPEEGEKKKFCRPPHVDFKWKEIEFKAKMESVRHLSDVA